MKRFVLTLGCLAASASAFGAQAPPRDLVKFVAEMGAQAGKCLEGASVAQLQELVRTDVRIVTAFAQDLRALEDRIRDAGQAVAQWTDKVDEAKQAGKQKPALELGRRERTLKRLKWDRDYTRLQAMRRMLELALAEQLLDKADKKPDPTHYGLTAKAPSVAFALMTQRLDLRLAPDQRDALLTVLHQIGPLADKLGVKLSMTPAAVPSARMETPVWRFGDRWTVQATGPKDEKVHGVFVLKTMRWTGLSVQYEAGLFTAASDREKHRQTASLFFESRLDEKPGWRRPGQPAPPARDLYLFEIRYRGADGKWVRQELKQFSDGPFPCIGQTGGVRIDFPYVWAGPYTPGIGRYFPITVTLQKPEPRTLHWDTIQRMAAPDADGRVAIDLVQPRIRHEGPTVSLVWDGEAGWWRRTSGQGYTTTLLGRTRLENTPLGLVADIARAREKGQDKELAAFVDPRVRMRLRPEAIAASLDAFLKAVAEFRPQDLTFTKSNEARLRTASPYRMVDIRFRLDGKRWVLDEDMFKSAQPAGL